LETNYSVITLRIVSIVVFLLMLAPFLDRDCGFLKMKRKTVIELCIGGLVANGVG
jgi:hypothetical protein